MKANRWLTLVSCALFSVAACSDSDDAPAETDTGMLDDTGVGTDTARPDTASSDTARPDTLGTDATGTDTSGTDATGTDTLGTDTSGTDATGTDTATSDAPGADVRDVGADASAAGCLASGGTVGTAKCCDSTGPFPNTCAVGACSCAPGLSHDVPVCNCGAGKCFDGTTCKTGP
jgi:hypothetical protein